MLPLAMKLEECGESRSPLAVVVMGGVISSTVLTLVLVPSVYTILDDAKVAAASLRQRIRSIGRTQRAPILPAPVRGAED